MLKKAKIINNEPKEITVITAAGCKGLKTDVITKTRPTTREGIIKG